MVVLSILSVDGRQAPAMKSAAGIHKPLLYADSGPAQHALHVWLCWSGPSYASMTARTLQPSTVMRGPKRCAASVPRRRCPAKIGRSTSPAWLLERRTAGRAACRRRRDPLPVSQATHQQVRVEHPKLHMLDLLDLRGGAHTTSSAPDGARPRASCAVLGSATIVPPDSVAPVCSPARCCS